MAVQDLYITNHLKYEIFIQVLSIFNRPGVAGAVLQSPP